MAAASGEVSSPMPRSAIHPDEIDWICYAQARRELVTRSGDIAAAGVSTMRRMPLPIARRGAGERDRRWNTPSSTNAFEMPCIRNAAANEIAMTALGRSAAAIEIAMTALGRTRRQSSSDDRIGPKRGGNRDTDDSIGPKRGGNRDSDDRIGSNYAGVGPIAESNNNSAPSTTATPPATLTPLLCSCWPTMKATNPQTTPMMSPAYAMKSLAPGVVGPPVAGPAIACAMPTPMAGTKYAATDNIGPTRVVVIV
ncbi:MAG: hypothetical protein ACKV2T_03795 [Kofleriaceae bacterium]